MPSSRDDADLLSAHLTGDRRAFAELYRRHHPRLCRLARGRTATNQDAEDVVQEALLAMHRAAGSFRNDCAVSSWLHRIVINACTDRARRNRCPTTEVTDDTAVTPDFSGASDTALAVRQALRALPAEQRAAVIAVDMLGYSVADAARLLNVAEGTIKSRRARARAHLAVLLGPR